MTMTAETEVSWRQRASCVGHSPEIFFPSRGDLETFKLALSLCSECPVKELCLEDNLSERSGIFGGTTGRQRQVIRSTQASFRNCIICGAMFSATRSHTMCSQECRTKRRLAQKRASNTRRQSVRRAEAEAQGPSPAS